jgi:peptidoglycan/xylan/chitin deacetylase (PgdA/CDA1 family)
MMAPKGIILALHRLAHDVGNDPLNGLNVSLDEFRSCLDLLTANGFEIVSMGEAMARLERHGPTPKFAVLTFDDGYRDNHSILLPELSQRRIPVVVYVTTGFIDRSAPMWWYGVDRLLKAYGVVELDGRSYSDFSSLQDCINLGGQDGLYRNRALAALEARYSFDFRDITDMHAMDWSMVRDLAETGLVEIGAHGVSHVPLTRLSHEAARQELQASAERVREETGRTATHLAFPYGDRASVAARDVELAAALGFATAVTSVPGLVRSRDVNRHALRRVVLGGTGMVDRLRASLSGLTAEQPIVGRG